MKTIVKTAVFAFFMMFLVSADFAGFADQPLSGIVLVGEAEAFFVRRSARRSVIIGTAAVASSAAATSAAASTAAAAPAPHTPPPAKAPQPTDAKAVPIDTVVKALPGGCTPVVAGGTSYSQCGDTFYRAAFQGNNLVYVVVEKPTN